MFCLPAPLGGLTAREVPKGPPDMSPTRGKGPVGGGPRVDDREQGSLLQVNFVPQKIRCR